ncbi:MAG: HNH endonuclease signature motif containing protein [Mycoplasmoidaceae bacterium]
MNKSLIEKVNFIMNCFFNGDLNYIEGFEKVERYFKKPMIWNMDTDIFNMMKRLYENIKNFDKVREIEIRNAKNNNKNGNDLYSLIVNGINVTPAKIQKEVAYSTIRQYCQILTSLDIVMFSDFKKEGFILECHGIKEKLEKFENMGLSIIFNGQKSAISWVRNLGFSLFMSLLYYKNFDFINFDKEYEIIEKRKRNKNSGIKFLAIKDSKKEIEQMYNETYKNLIINNFENYDLEKIIDSICDYINENNNDYEIIKKVEEKNRQNAISAERSRFKKMILDDRLSKKLISDKNDIYSDLVNFNNGDDRLTARFNDLHACHIYEVKDIKRENDSIYHVSNPSNGIMMKSEYHWAFDKGLFIFNEDGEFRCREEEESYLFNTLKLEKCRIRREVFDESMKQYLKKRISS